MSSNHNDNIPEYFWPHFENIAKQVGFTDYKIERDTGEGQGDGFMAQVMLIALIGNRRVNNEDMNDRINLICKLLPRGEIRQRQFSSSDLFQREVFFYSKVVPIFVKFQQEKGLTAENGFFSFPKCYVAEFDPETKECAIIMEDIRDNGFQTWDKTKPITIEYVKLVITALGRMHALSFALRDQQPEVFREFYKMTDVMLIMTKQRVVREMFATAIDLSVDTLESEEDLTIMRRIQETWLDIWQECLGDNVAEPFSVVGHADCWHTNVMFLTENNQAKRVCIYDWQMARLGSPALDISYFMLSSTQKRLRDEYFEELLKLYYVTLAETIKLCGSDPNALFTFQDMENQFKKFARYGLTYAPTLISVMVSEDKNIADMDKYAIEAEMNCGKYMGLAVLDDHSRPEFVKRTSAAIRDLVKFGWLDGL